MGFTISTKIRLEVSIVAINGDLIDPTTLIFTMTSPDNNITTFIYPTNNEIVKESVGIYYIDWIINQIGFHKFNFQTTGNVIVSKSASFIGDAKF